MKKKPSPYITISRPHDLTPFPSHYLPISLPHYLTISRATRGFTLIELVIIIILVGIVAMVVAPKITTSDIEKNADVVRLMSDIRYVQHKSMITGGGKGIEFTSNGYKFVKIKNKEDVNGLSAITPPSPNTLYFDYLGRPDNDNISTNNNIVTDKITINIGGKNIYIDPYAGGVYE